VRAPPVHAARDLAGGWQGVTAVLPAGAAGPVLRPLACSRVPELFWSAHL
jgi:hypothetical protein